MQDHYQRIYSDSADAYDRLVNAEDCEDRLLPALESICPLEGARVVEIGVGTGRLTRLFVRGGAKSVIGVEPSPAMLAVARRHLTACAPPGSPCTWRLETGDSSRLPVPDGDADLTIAGWVFGHMTAWSPGTWREFIADALAEADRVTRRGGHEIILETLGTGAEAAGPPNQDLADYYSELETKFHFRRQEIRTDYQFASPDEAAQTCGFFFGEEMAARIRARGWARVPEWTGLWSRAR